MYENCFQPQFLFSKQPASMKVAMNELLGSLEGIRRSRVIQRRRTAQGHTGGINVSSHRARWRKKGISGAEYACRHCFSPSNVLFGNSAGSPRNHCSRLEGNWLLDETALLSHKSSVTIQFDSLYSTEMCLVTLLWHYWSWSLVRQLWSCIDKGIPLIWSMP